MNEGGSSKADASGRRPPQQRKKKKEKKKRRRGHAEKKSGVKTDAQTQGTRVSGGRSVPSSRERSRGKKNAGTASTKSKESKQKSARMQQQKRKQREKSEEQARKKREAEEAARREKEAEEKREREEAEAREKRRREEALSSLKALSRTRTIRRKLCAENATERLEAAREDFAGQKLKSDLKKTSTLITKIKMTNSGKTVKEIVASITKLKLNRFKSEIISALIENAIGCKSADVLGAAGEVCSCIHLRYPEIVPQVISALVKVVDSSPDAYESKQRRAALRYLTELSICGLDPNLKAVCILERLLDKQGTLKKPMGKVSLGMMSLVVCMLKYASKELLGVVSKHEQRWRSVTGGDNTSCLEENLSIPTTRQSAIRASLDRTRASLTETLIEKTRALRALERANEEAKILHGTLSEKRVEKYANMKKKYDKLDALVQSTCDALCVDHVDLDAVEDDDDDDDLNGSAGISLWHGEGDGASKSMDPSEGPFEDEARRSFYEDIPDLCEIIPPVLLQSKNVRRAELEAERAKRDAERKRKQESACDSVGTAGTLDDALRQFECISVSGETTSSAPAPAANNKTTTTTTKPTEKMPAIPQPSATEDEDEASTPVLPSAALENLLDTLPHCLSADSALTFCIDFCYMSSKANRKKLVEKLYAVPRTALELLPYYALIAKMLGQIFPDDICPPLVDRLKGTFFFLSKKKDPKHTHGRILNARFVGELVKFRAAPPQIAFVMLKRCFADFTPHNIVSATSLLETCGRFLYRTPVTHKVCARQLDILMRLKSAKLSDENLEYLIENAYFVCVPAKVNASAKRETLSPMERYLRHIVLERTERRQNIKSVAAKLQKLPSELLFTTVNIFLDVTTRGKYECMKNVCQLLSRLEKSSDGGGIGKVIVARVVDSLCESIRAGLECSDFRQNQRRVGEIKMLGELCVARIIPSALVLDMLYLILEVGHCHDMFATSGGARDPRLLRRLLPHEPRTRRSHPSVLTKSDEPHDSMRIRLVCVLLDTVGKMKRFRMWNKIDAFLLYFDRYVAYKWSVPLETKFMIECTLELLRPERDVPTVGNVKETEISVKKYEDALRWTEVKSQDRNDDITSGVANVAINEDGCDSESCSDDDDSDAEEIGKEDVNPDTEGVDVSVRDANSVDGDGEEDAKLEEDRVELIGFENEKDNVEEDPEFEKAMRAMMQSGSSVRMRSNLDSHVRDRLAIPVALLGERHSRGRGETSGGDAGTSHEGGVTFKLLSRRKGKVATSNLTIPSDVSLARYAINTTDTERKEREELRRRVLELGRAQEAVGDEAVVTKINQRRLARRAFGGGGSGRP